MCNIFMLPKSLNYHIKRVNRLFTNKRLEKLDIRKCVEYKIGSSITKLNII